MTESVWKVVFLDSRTNREGSQSFDNQKDFERRIEEIKTDIWLKFLKGILPNGTEITG
jgi:hypothetical protein